MKPRTRTILCLLLWGAVIVFALLHRNELTPEGIANAAPEQPVLAALALLALFALKSLTVVLYSGLLYAASGLLFPLPAAIPLNLCGTLIMASVPYWLGRRAGAESAVRIREKYPKLRFVERLRSGNDFAFALLLRSVKVMNFDLGSTYMGAVRLRYGPYLLGSALGMLPAIVLYPIIGSDLANFFSAPFWITLGFEGAMTLFSVLFLRRQMKKYPGPAPAGPDAKA